MGTAFRHWGTGNVEFAGSIIGPQRTRPSSRIRRKIFWTYTVHLLRFLHHCSFVHVFSRVEFFVKMALESVDKQLQARGSTSPRNDVEMLRRLRSTSTPCAAFRRILLCGALLACCLHCANAGKSKTTPKLVSSKLLFNGKWSWVDVKV